MLYTSSALYRRASPGGRNIAEWALGYSDHCSASQSHNKNVFLLREVLSMPRRSFSKGWPNVNSTRAPQSMAFAAISRGGNPSYRTGE